MVRENGGWECFTMIVIKIFPCETKMEACIEEDRIMREMKTSMNTKRAYTTPEEKREYDRQYHKEYRESNREELQKYIKEYFQANKEQITEYKKRVLTSKQRSNK